MLRCETRATRALSTPLHQPARRAVGWPYVDIAFWLCCAGGAACDDGTHRGRGRRAAPQRRQWPTAPLHTCTRATIACAPKCGVAAGVCREPADLLYRCNARMALGAEPDAADGFGVCRAPPRLSAGAHKAAVTVARQPLPQTLCCPARSLRSVYERGQSRVA